MIYEAFRSEVVSKLNKFLVKKIGKGQSNSFIRSLRSVQKIFNFPISEIKDEDVKYLSAKKSLQIKAPKDWTPSSDNISYDIYAFKFWFSLERGFLGQSGIGSKEIEYEEDSYGKNKPFDKKEVDYIKNKLGINKGELEPVKDYSKLKHGQEVIGFFNSESNWSALGKAKIYIDDDSLFAIQEVSNGGEPNSGNWRNWGSLSWSLGDIYGDIGSDHKKLHIYKETEEELHIKGEDDKDEEENPLTWNLPIDGTYLENWRYYDKSIIEDADFCIVFYIDDVIKRGYKKVSGYRAEREEIRKGATALYTDEQVKNMNIERYMTDLISRMGIKSGSEVEDLKSLERVLKMSICGRFPIYALYSARSKDYIRGFISDLQEVIRYKGDYEFDNLKERFIRYKKDFSNYKKYYNESEKIIMNSDNSLLLDVFKSIKEINDEITSYINSQKISTLSDLQSIYLKLDYIKNIFEANETGDLNVYRLIRNMYDISDVKYYSNDYYADEQLEEDLKKLKNIKRYIKSVLN